MDAESYSSIADEVFAPLYPYYAEKIVRETWITEGSCLDAGCGCGHLGLAMLDAGDFDLCSLDRSAEMLQRTAENARVRGLSGRVRTIVALVESIPMPGASFDLVVSRGSMPFWSDLAAAFAEIQRVLKPGGEAYIGGGLGTKEMRESIQLVMRQREPEGRWRDRERIPRRTVEEYISALDRAGIAHGRVERGEEGTWIRFRKQ